ncbi:MAG: restriction endonuclease subunit S [Helicobacteraceae bacterium]|jgi:type I restriction enzyme S subunit|nr:restriction endonuclease subunit S [Helicobacteraceae bacterium]
MAENADKYPKLRFPGFTDAWERRELGGLGDVLTGNTPPTSDKSNWTDGKNGFVWITPTDINGLLISDSERHLSEMGWKKARTVPTKSVLITSIASIGKNAINAVPAAFNQQINAIVPIRNDAYFILSAMTRDTQRFASLAGQTATAIINKTEFEKFTISIPSLNEQIAIGRFFTNLDHLITLHQRECDKTVNIKKALLEKMFPKDGENKPEIRFPGFTDAWERREFEELVFRVSLQSDEYHLPRVEYEDIVSGQGQLNKDIFEKKSSKTGIRFEAQDILFGKLRPYLHNWLLPDFTGIAVGDWWVLRPNETSHKFIYALIQSAKYQYVSNLSIGTKMPRSDWSVVSKTQFVVPSDIVEQAKIGMFFVNLDRLITLHQRELKKLQNIKKALLDNMFA